MNEGIKAVLKVNIASYAFSKVNLPGTPSFVLVLSRPVLFEARRFVGVGYPGFEDTPAKVKQ